LSIGQFQAAFAMPSPPLRACRRVAASTCAPLSRGAITGCRPNFAASAKRRSGCPTERSSPVSPTSPKHATGFSPPPSATPRAALATASATARSAPGSSTRTPPATLTNTSAEPTLTPPGRHEVGRRDQRLHLHEQRARALHRGEHGAAGCLRRLADEPRRRVGHLDEAALAHLEDADVVGRAEAVLQRP